MPRKSRRQRKERKEHKAAAHTAAAHPTRHRPRARSRVRHERVPAAAVPRSDPKTVTTRVSNLRPAGVRPYAANQAKDSQMAAVCVLDPFAAFARQYKTGLPFAPMTPPSFGFWTRSVTRQVEFAWTGVANTFGMSVLIVPWVKPQVLVAGALGATGVPVATSITGVADPQAAFISSNIDVCTVAYQAVRVRNLTNVLQQGGELVIGLTSYEQWNANTYDQNRSSSMSITHANGDPGVIAQCSWVGNPANAESASTAGSLIAVSDYRFVEPSQNVIDPEMRCIFVSSLNGGGAAPANGVQVYEFEIVTYYLGIPLATPSQILAPLRYDVDPNMVNRMLDAAYTKTPQFDIARNFIKDDGWSDLWTGVKDIVKDIGLGFIGQAAASAGSAFAGLFAGKRRPHGLLRILSLMPPDVYPEFRRILAEYADHESAVAAVQASCTKRSALTTQDLERIAEFLDRDAAVVVPETAAMAAGGVKPGWFGRK